jgi:PKD repeat protein
VKLIASSTETNDALTKDVVVSRNSDGRGPVAGLTYSRLSTNSLSYSFTMTGVGVIKYSLDFGDGSPPSTYQPTSNSQVVNHTYAGPGRYVAKLLASNDEGQNCTEVFVNVDP